MPGNLMFADLSFPSIGEEEDTRAALQRVQNYLFMLLENLRYVLQNLDPSNFNGAELEAYFKKLTADLVVADVVVSNTIITNELYAKYGAVADLTVDRLRTDFKKAKNYLEADTSPIDYISIHDEEISFISATTDGTRSEQLVVNGRAFWWTDATKIQMTAEENTGIPVMVYVYTELVKRSIRFADSNGTKVPVDTFGAGSGVGNNGKGFIYKDRSGIKMQYFSAIDGAERCIYLNDDGVEVVPGFDGQGATLYTGLDSNKPNVVGLNIEETLASVSAFNDAAGLGYSFAEQTLVACNQTSSIIQYVTRGGEFVRQITLDGSPTSLNGIEIDGDNDDYVWTTNGSRIFKFNNKTGADISPATTAYANSNGMAAPPGDYIYFGIGNNLQKAMKTTGAEVAQYAMPIGVSGVAYDGAGHLWVVGASSTVVLFDIATGTIIQTDTLPASSYTGATFDGNSLWAVDYNADAAVRVKTTNRDKSFYLATDTKKLYVASGGAWVDVSGSGSPLALGETSTTAYRGDRGKTAYDHSQSDHAPSNAQKNSDITKAEIEAKLTGEIATHTHAGGASLGIVNVAATGSISASDSGKLVLCKQSSAITLSLPGVANALNFFVKNAGSNNVTIYGFSDDWGGIDSYTKVMLHCDGAQDSTTITDVSGKTWAAHGNAKIDNADKVFGSGCLKLDGDGDYISTQDHADFNFGSGDFTIDFRAKLTVAQELFDTFFSIYTDSNNRFAVTMNGSDVTVHGLNAGSTTVFCTTSDARIGLNTWYHIAIVRSGTNLYIFVNGVAQEISKINEIGVNSLPDCTGPATIGARYTGTADRFITGLIDEFRVSKGTARWTSNFTPPVGAYTAPGGTAEIDNSTSGLVIAPLEAKRVVCDGTEWWTI